MVCLGEGVIVEYQPWESSTGKVGRSVVVLLHLVQLEVLNDCLIELPDHDVFDLQRNWMVLAFGDSEYDLFTTKFLCRIIDRGVLVLPP